MIKRWIDDKIENDPASLFYVGMVLVLVFAFIVNTVLAVVLNV